MEKEINRRHAYYNEVVKPAMKEKFGYKIWKNNGSTC